MIELFNRRARPRRQAADRIGIGIASGDMVAGYTGTQARATYTCVGDTVNVSARLEAQTKTAGHVLLIDGATRGAMAERCRFEFLGSFVLKGKEQPVEVFAVPSGQKVQ